MDAKEKPSRREVQFLASYIVVYYILILSAFYLATRGFLPTDLDLLTRGKLPYFMKYGYSSSFNREIFSYYLFSFPIVMIFHIVPLIKMKSLRDYRFIVIFFSFLGYWLFGMDGRGLKLSQMQDGNFSAALFYSFLIPLIQLFMFWLSGLFYSKRSGQIERL